MLKNLNVIPVLTRWILSDESNEVHYIGGPDVLPAPLEGEEEAKQLEKLINENDESARRMLIEHNLRLVVYIAKKFDNTGVGVEDLISIGTIGLILVNQYLIMSGKDFTILITPTIIISSIVITIIVSIIAGIIPASKAAKLDIVEVINEE